MSAKEQKGSWAERQSSSHVHQSRNAKKPQSASRHEREQYNCPELIVGPLIWRWPPSGQERLSLLLSVTIKLHYVHLVHQTQSLCSYPQCCAGQNVLQRHGNESKETPGSPGLWAQLSLQPYLNREFILTPTLPLPMWVFHLWGFSCLLFLWKSKHLSRPSSGWRNWTLVPTGDFWLPLDPSSLSLGQTWQPSWCRRLLLDWNFLEALGLAWIWILPLWFMMCLWACFLAFLGFSVTKSLKWE